MADALVEHIASQLLQYPEGHPMRMQLLQALDPSQIGGILDALTPNERQQFAMESRSPFEKGASELFGPEAASFGQDLATGAAMLSPLARGMRGPQAGGILSRAARGPQGASPPPQAPRMPGGVGGRQAELPLGGGALRRTPGNELPTQVGAPPPGGGSQGQFGFAGRGMSPAGPSNMAGPPPGPGTTALRAIPLGKTGMTPGMPPPGLGAGPRGLLGAGGAAGGKTVPGGRPPGGGVPPDMGPLRGTGTSGGAAGLARFAPAAIGAGALLGLEGDSSIGAMKPQAVQGYDSDGPSGIGDISSIVQESIRQASPMGPPSPRSISSEGAPTGAIPTLEPFAVDDDPQADAGPQTSLEGDKRRALWASMFPGIPMPEDLAEREGSFDPDMERGAAGRPSDMPYPSADMEAQPSRRALFSNIPDTAQSGGPRGGAIPNFIPMGNHGPSGVRGENQSGLTLRPDMPPGNERPPADNIYRQLLDMGDAKRKVKKSMGGGMRRRQPFKNDIGARSGSAPPFMPGGF